MLPIPLGARCGRLRPTLFWIATIAILPMVSLQGAAATEPPAPTTTAAPAPGPKGALVADADAHREVEAAMQRYTGLLKTGPPEALAASYTADGELLEPGLAALHGREAIQGFLAPIFTAFEVQSATTESEAVEVFGNAAYQWGTYRQRAGERGKTAADYRGRYVASWRREADGQWRLARFLVQPFPASGS
jgi:uncharacterized protein (TIGR02246 family)